MTNKPKWVEALEAAETALRSINAGTPVDQAQAINQSAHAWMEIARLYRDSPST